MVYYMTSKSLNTFLNKERDSDILKAQYVTVSTRIRVKNVKKYDNILQARNILFPDANVCNRVDEDDFKEAYYRQLDKCRPTLAAILKGSIEEGYNIIFLCTKNEGKIGKIKQENKRKKQSLLLKTVFPFFKGRINQPF